MHQKRLAVGLGSAALYLKGTGRDERRGKDRGRGQGWRDQGKEGKDWMEEGRNGGEERGKAGSGLEISPHGHF